MAGPLRFDVKQTQKLAMTESLRQAIELLQLSTIELSERISQELLENPVLEEELSPPDAPYDGERELMDDVSRNLSFDDQAFENQGDTLSYGDTSDNEYINERDNTLRNDYYENITAQKESLTEHLLWQANMMAENEEELLYYQSIITVLDENGFLPDGFSMEDISSDNTEGLTDVLSSIQHFDPVGCGASSVQDSLLIQARYYFPEETIVHEILSSYFIELEKLDYYHIASQMKISEKEVIEKSRIIQSLLPFPGRQYQKREIRYIMADVDVKVVDDELIITMNDDWVPSIRINNYYVKMLEQKKIEQKLKNYIQDKVQAAKYLVRNISSRRDTIIKVARAIMERQWNFLLKGPGHLKPLTHVEIAREIEMHESTVSRVASNKYVQTSWGVFGLKDFFVSRIKSAEREDGNEQSSDAVQNLIQDIVNQENPDDPYSDEDIVKILHKAGFSVARRTISKYRGILHIPASGKRKRINMLKQKE